MITLTNNGKSPRGVHDVNGRCVVVEPGQSKRVDLDAAGIRMIQRFGGLDMASPPVGISESGEVVTFLGELRTQAETLGVTVDKRWKEKRLLEVIEKATQEADDAVHGTDSGTTEGEVSTAE